MGILDQNGALQVSYTYDAWGNILSVGGPMASTLGQENPLRYRGYVYDAETGLYYLQSRYYDPELGRFLNADAFAATGQGLVGNNMFAYCLNNPVNSADSLGSRCVQVSSQLSGGGQYVGSAPDYIAIGESDGDRTQNPNCYAYAIGYYDQSYDPGDFSSGLSDLTLGAVEDALVADMAALNRGCRPIESYNSVIAPNEYRIALRVSDIVENPFFGIIEWDYHFMVQTSTGKWAEKCGAKRPTVLHHLGNPSTISWDFSSIGGYNYIGPIKYYAITN